MYTHEAQLRNVLDIRVVNGKEAMAMCPFHDNKHTPSMQVNLETGLWVCFVCENEKTGRNLGGTYKMLTRMLGKRYTEPEYSVKTLRRMVMAIEEIDLEPKQARRPISENTLKRYLAVHTTYWQTRGFTAETVIEWQLGYDPMTDAAIIPVRNWKGELLGVIQRYLSGPIKYMYPGGFPRRYDMFGSWKVKGGRVALVEGSLDAIACWQAGVPALAQYGSSITPEQCRLLLRLGVTEAVLMFDNDKAGKKATKKAQELVQGITLSVGSYPRGVKDPGELTDQQIREMFGTALTVNAC
jgi:DNA primase